MQRPLTQSGAERFWKNIKTYITENTYPKLPPPNFYFDPETSSLYMEKPAAGYDFKVVDGKIYYKER